MDTNRTNTYPKRAQQEYPSPLLHLATIRFKKNIKWEKSFGSEFPSDYTGDGPQYKWKTT